MAKIRRIATSDAAHSRAPSNRARSRKAISLPARLEFAPLIHRPPAFLRLALSFALAATLLPLLTPCLARGATPERVDQAIEKGKKFLYSQQHPTGHWEKDPQRKGTKHDWQHQQGDAYGGYTAIATYALLAAGESPQDKRIAKAVTFLEDADVIGIYSLGLRANVWLFLPSTDKRARAMSRHDATLIIKGMNTGKQNPQNKGFWDYGNGRGENLRGSGRLDHSVSQYGVLGLWACTQNDAEVGKDVWALIDAGWKAHQFPEGGWEYNGTPTKPSGDHQQTPSMTAAGVATLFITEEMLFADKGVECRGNITNSNIEKGLDWMSQHFGDVDDPYSFYGVERIGVASGRKYFGATNWYAAGAEKLVHSQNADGSWNGGLGGPISNTAFAMLFLSRGRAPVMMNKLQYDVVQKLVGKVTEGNWNQRPRDVANLARWSGNRMERDLNWQIVNLKASADDLHDAPILYISGSDELNFTAEEETKLRQFVEGGGMVLANEDCGIGKPLFGKSFLTLGHKLFPKYEFRELPSSHLIFTNEPYKAEKWKNKPRVMGLSNGVRELLLLVPEADPARSWQVRADQTHADAFQFGADVFLYAVDKSNFNYKGVSFIVHANPAVHGEKTAKIARLLVGDNPNPEPAGWERLAAILHNDYKADITVEYVKPGQKLTGFKILDLTGTTRFTLTAEMRRQLVEFVVHGGTLVIDAAGGNPDFADSAETELRILFGAEADAALKEPLEPESPIFDLAGARIDAFTYRPIYRRTMTGHLKAPRLRGIHIGARIGVFYSREDLSAGLVGEPVDGIMGYTTQTATDIMRSIVLYSAFGVRPPPGTQRAPATQPAPPAPFAK